MQRVAPSVVVLIAASLVIGCACKDTEAKRPSGSTASGAAAALYDAAPMARALRPEARRALLSQLGLSSLAALPLYDIGLDVDPSKRTIAGRLQLHWINRSGRPLHALPLLLHPNAPRELGRKQDTGALSVNAVRAVQGPGAKLRRRRPTLVEVAFARPLRPGERVVIDVRFSGRLRALPPGANDIFSQALASLGVGGAGSGASDYGLLAIGDGIATLASAYPMVAPFRERKFDTSRPPRFGDLAYNTLANYRVKVSVPSGTVVATNLMEVGSARRGRRSVVTAVGAANRDLVLVLGRRLQRSSQDVGGVKVSSIYLSRDRAAGQRALRTAVAALRLFERRFGPYPFRELDVAEATLVGGAGGVEFPGLVLIAGMLYRPPSRSASPLALLLNTLGGIGGALQGGGAPAGGLSNIDQVVETMAAFTVAHEVAHQYFAGLVGTDARRHPAVDEPLAQFAAGEAMRAGRGDAEGRRLLEMNAKMSYAVYRMIGGKDLPAAQPVRRFPTALAYAAIVYGKAPYLYVDLQRSLGQERFYRMLRGAVDDHRFKLVTLEGWIAALRRHAGAHGDLVARRARRWLHETHGDTDLGVDGSGDAVLEAVLGRAALTELTRALAPLGMQPADLLRMLLGGLNRGSP